jgi:hypothetical protein
MFVFQAPEEKARGITISASHGEERQGETPGEGGIAGDDTGDLWLLLLVATLLCVVPCVRM